MANICLASRKDFRDAVTAARSAFAAWSDRSAFNRGQILYRMAEMLEGRRAQFTGELIQQGMSAKAAALEVETGIDRLVYYAGWCDKYQQLFSSVNPVSSPHFNFSMPEPMGVVSIIAPPSGGLLGLISVVAPAISGGNTGVVLADEKFPLTAMAFAEVLSTSDLPGGVVNILTGSAEELHGHFSSHMDVNAAVYCNRNARHIKTMQENSALNVKRFFNWQYDWKKEESQNPYRIMDLQEIKTTWHPIEKTTAASAGY